MRNGPLQKCQMLGDSLLSRRLSRHRDILPTRRPISLQISLEQSDQMGRVSITNMLSLTRNAYCAKLRYELAITLHFLLYK